MNTSLQIKMIIFSVLFFLFITYTVRKKHLGVKQSLKWYLAAVVFIVISIFPQVLFTVSRWVGIAEPTNAVFLLIIAFMLLIMFINNLTISKTQEDVVRLVQEISILKAELKEKDYAVRAVDSAVSDAGDRSDPVEI